jgi:methionyl aminopeptidase
VTEKDLAGRQQLHAARAACEQIKTELVFERANLSAQWRLRDVQHAGCRACRAFIGDRDEVAQLVEAHAQQSTTPTDTQRVLARIRASTPSFSGMAVTIHSNAEIARMRRAGSVAATTLALVNSRLRAGISTADIDMWVRQHTAECGDRPSQLGYHGFPATVCTSVNDVVCHGIPSKGVVLQPGDIINVDVTTCHDGFHGDNSATFFIGEPSSEARHVVDVACRCRDAGIAAVCDGARLGDIGAAMEELATAEGCSVVRDFGGHGIGRAMHMDPHIPNHGQRNTGRRVRTGMCFTIEPMVNLGSAEVQVLDDGWTVVTADGSLSAQFEHTIVVTRRGCEILTALSRAGAA